MLAIMWKRRFRRFPALAAVLRDRHYAIDYLDDDLPVTEEELGILEGHFVELTRDLYELDP